MAEISYEERLLLEDFLDMGQGYILNFNNSTLQEFVNEKVGVDIYSKKYSLKGDSKAKRIREFWRLESDYLVSQLIEAFIVYYQFGRTRNPNYFKAPKEQEEKCKKIVERLKEGGVSTQLSNITPLDDSDDFKKLSKSIKESIEDNEPELALDRLHTFFMKYIRELCNKNGISFLNADSLNAIFGKYLKFIENKVGFESEMTKAILKYSISLLEKYNDVRNNSSFAHDNKLLNYSESLYIFDTLARLKGFIDKIQQDMEIEMTIKADTRSLSEDLPF
jgi:hypothetical protein